MSVGVGLVDHRRAPEGSLTVAVRSLDYPETALFMALPRFCISSPMPRTVAHPSRAHPEAGGVSPTVALQHK